jgi:RimJ/RimL family protein N-acetyltransferase
MRIETERLILRYLKESNLESIFYNYVNGDEVTKYLKWTF